MAKKTKKKELGLGVRALLSSQPAQPKTPEETQELVRELSNTVATIEVSKIFPNRDQPRNMDDADRQALEELANSLKVHGLIQPITVRSMGDGTYQIISGERRWQASKIAGLKAVPTYIRIANDQEMMEMALVENIQREDLNPVEMATSLARLKEEFKLTDADVAQRIGKARVTVTGYLGVLSLPPSMIEALRNGDISMGHAKELSRVDDMNLRHEFFTRTVEESLSVRALEEAIKEDREKRNQTKKPAKSSSSNLPEEYHDVLDNLRRRFGSKKINIKVKNGKGQIVLPFANTEELNTFLDIIEGE